MEKDFYENRINQIKKSIESLQKQNDLFELLSEAQEFLSELEVLREYKEE